MLENICSHNRTAFLKRCCTIDVQDILKIHEEMNVSCQTMTCHPSNVLMIQEAKDCFTHPNVCNVKARQSKASDIERLALYNQPEMALLLDAVSVVLGTTIILLGLVFFFRAREPHSFKYFISILVLGSLLGITAYYGEHVLGNYLVSDYLKKPGAPTPSVLEKLNPVRRSMLLQDIEKLCETTTCHPDKRKTAL